LSFTIRQLIEKLWEFDKDMVIVYIDFEKAYDSIKKEKMWSNLRTIKLSE
jgi:hypothetical protein